MRKVITTCDFCNKEGPVKHISIEAGRKCDAAGQMETQFHTVEICFDCMRVQCHNFCYRFFQVADIFKKIVQNSPRNDEIGMAVNFVITPFEEFKAKIISKTRGLEEFFDKELE